MRANVCGNWFPADIGGRPEDSHLCTHPVGHEGEHQHIDQWGYVCASWENEDTAHQVITDAMAESVRTFMKRQGVNATQLSAMTGIPYPTMLRRLNAKTWFTIDEVFDIARALEVDVVGLMTASIVAYERHVQGAGPGGECRAVMPITREVMAICELPTGHSGQHEAAGESEHPFRWCACEKHSLATLAKSLPAHGEAIEGAGAVESDRDIAHQVRETLGGEVEDFDVAGITAAIVSRFGLVDLSTVPTQDYWAIVKAHDTAGGGENK